MFIFLLLGGLACILFPSQLLQACNVEMENEGCLLWGIRILGVVFLGISLWALFSSMASHHG